MPLKKNYTSIQLFQEIKLKIKKPSTPFSVKCKTCLESALVNFLSGKVGDVAQYVNITIL